MMNLYFWLFQKNHSYSRSDVKQGQAHATVNRIEINYVTYLPPFTVDMMQGPARVNKLYIDTAVEEIKCSMHCHISVSTIISETTKETFAITHPKILQS